MTFWEVPWLELAIGLALGGSIWVGCLRQPVRAFTWGLAFSGATLACSVLAWLASEPVPGAPGEGWSVQPAVFGRTLFELDQTSGPLVALVALLHFLTALATGRTKMRRFSMAWSLASESIRLATFACREPGLLVGLLIICTVPPYFELRNRGKPTRVFVIHMALFVGLLVLGWSSVNPTAGAAGQSAWATVPLLAAVLIRCGTVLAHCWVTDWFENASFGNGLLFALPLVGAYAAVRLVLPIAPDWALTSIGTFSLVTAVYAAGMAIVQTDTRRFFAYLFLSHSSLILIGLELHTPISLTGALALWVAVPLSLAGLGLTLRALEARFGRLSLAQYHGLYEHSPTLAVCFLLTGLASVSFPGTLNFVGSELLVDGAVSAGRYAGLAVVLAAAINGIAIVAAYFKFFTGGRHVSAVALNVGPRERIAVLIIMALILGGGLFPQLGLEARYRAAQSLLRERAENLMPGGPLTGPAMRPDEQQAHARP